LHWRALVYSPGVLLDEPLSNLGAKLWEQGRIWLKRLQREVGVTTAYVTHDQLEALALSDCIAVMGDGSMLQVGGLGQVHESPSSPEVAKFMGRCNFLPARVRRFEPDAGPLTVELEPIGRPAEVRSESQNEPGTPVTIAVRSERLQLSEQAQRDGAGVRNVFDAGFWQGVA
jgi:iron(III) transport system ATP-binding protein